MFRDYLIKIGWNAARVVVTLVALVTIQNVIAQEGYRVEFHDLLIVAICAIISIRIWMPSHKCEKEFKGDKYV